jgi:hypothetical protein
LPAWHLCKKDEGEPSTQQRGEVRNEKETVYLVTVDPCSRAALASIHALQCPLEAPVADSDQEPCKKQIRKSVLRCEKRTRERKEQERNREKNARENNERERTLLTKG